jgi:nucleotidyltransferase substrate binding protein (TIGR01987 family)
MEQSTGELGKLIKAQAMFERFRRDMQDDRDQMGAVLAFKICYELALRVMKAALVVKGLEATSPKEIFRQAAVAKLIPDSEVWFGFQGKRNLTAHVYEQENLITVVESFDIFSLNIEEMIQAASMVIAKD